MYIHKSSYFSHTNNAYFYDLLYKHTYNLCDYPTNNFKPCSAGHEFNIPFANSVDPDQRAPGEEPSDQGLHCLSYFHIFARKPLICQNALVEIQNWNIPFLNSAL